MPLWNSRGEFVAFLRERDADATFGRKLPHDGVIAWHHNTTFDASRRVKSLRQLSIQKRVAEDVHSESVTTRFTEEHELPVVERLALLPGTVEEDRAVRRYGGAR